MKGTIVGCQGGDDALWLAPYILRYSGAIYTPNNSHPSVVPKRMQINRCQNPIETVFDALSIPFPWGKVFFYKRQ